MTVAEVGRLAQWGETDLPGEVHDPDYPWTAEAWAAETAAGETGWKFNWDEWNLTVQLPISKELCNDL